MTNGEKIIAILKPRKDQIRIYDNWVEIEIQKLGINFSCELDWWNTECNEPTRIDLGVDAVSRKAVHDMLENLPITVEDKWFNWLQKACMRLAEMPSVTPQEPQTFKWCTNCKEYDQEKHCCHRWSNVIRDTVEEMKQEYIEREVLDKIRAEILEYIDDLDIANEICGVFDKYETESEEV